MAIEFKGNYIVTETDPVKNSTYYSLLNPDGNSPLIGFTLTVQPRENAPRHLVLGVILRCEAHVENRSSHILGKLKKFGFSGVSEVFVPSREVQNVFRAMKVRAGQAGQNGKYISNDSCVAELGCSDSTAEEKRLDAVIKRLMTSEPVSERPDVRQGIVTALFSLMASDAPDLNVADAALAKFAGAQSAVA